jgi:hypothetical protein
MMRLFTKLTYNEMVFNVDFYLFVQSFKYSPETHTQFFFKNIQVETKP